MVQSKPFTQLAFAKYEPLVWVDTENSSLIAEATEAVTGYEKVIRALDEKSLEEADSKELILCLYDASSPPDEEASRRSVQCLPPRWIHPRTERAEHA